MKNRAQAALNRELKDLEKREKRLSDSAYAEKTSSLRQEIEKRIPTKVYEGLESAFCKGFEAVFDKGRGLIGKSINSVKLSQDHSIRSYALNIKHGRREWRQMHKAAERSGLVNMAITTAEGIGLGVLGIGLPDIVLFLSGLMRGIYETALSYGFEYDSPAEQLLILKMMEASLSRGEERERLDEELAALLDSEPQVPDVEELKAQIRRTASVFAVDMLILKFIQGLPVVGILGGAGNPVYYKKVLDYVKLKYRRRFLLRHIAENNSLISEQ